MNTLTSLIILLEVIEVKNRRLYGKLLGSGYQRGSKNPFNEWLSTELFGFTFYSRSNDSVIQLSDD